MSGGLIARGFRQCYTGSNIIYSLAGAETYDMTWRSHCLYQQMRETPNFLNYFHYWKMTFSGNHSQKGRLPS